MPIPPCDTQAVHDALVRDYNIEIPVIAWQGQHFVRLSCQGYNTRQQMDLLVDALTDLLGLRTQHRKISQA